MLQDRMDLHTHTLASGHAYGTIKESIAAAKKLNLDLLGITEHGPAMPHSCGKIYFDNIDLLEKEQNGLLVLYGVELNLLDKYGRVDLPDSTLKRLDLSIASLHSPCYTNQGIKDNTMAYLKAMENPYINIIGHPDDIRFPVDYGVLAREAANTGVLLEMNSSSMDVRSYRQGAAEQYRKMLEECVKYGTKIIINSDAHVDDAVGIHQNALQIIEEEKFPEELIVNGDIEEVKVYLNYFRKKH